MGVHAMVAMMGRRRQGKGSSNRGAKGRCVRCVVVDECVVLHTPAALEQAMLMRGCS